MATSFMLKEMSKVLECAICLATMKNPRRLACEHYFCKSCLDKLLDFAGDGSCTIKCPKQCIKNTLISNNCTTNDLGVDYMMKSMIDVIASNDTSFDLVENKQTCEGITDCNIDISRYCPSCDSFFCQSCCCVDGKSQYFPVLYNTDDDQIKVLCEEHSTDANYLCCDPCGNEFICLYCSHRDHVGHSYDLVQNEAKRMKDNLQKEIQNISDFNKKLAVTLQQTESDISIAKYVLDETLKYRKLLCLNDYLHFLNKEEERLNAEFESITVNHRKQYMFEEDYTEFYEKIASKGGISIVMQTKDFLNNVCIHDTDKENITEETVTLSDHCFNAKHPLGDIGVDAGKCIAVDGVSKYFRSEVTNTDTGDKSLGENEVNLYENLQYLLQESFPKIKETLHNLLQENEILKDNLVKLKIQNEEIVSTHVCDKMYNSLLQQYNELKEQFEESSKLSKNVVEKEKDNMNHESAQEQEPLTSSLLSTVSPREQKQMIAERLLPLVKKIKSCSYVFTLPILLEIDNMKLLNLLESPQLLSAEVERVKQYHMMCTDKDNIVCAVKEAMKNDKKYPLYSSFSQDSSKQEPLTSSLLSTVSPREQKQMIAERLLPLVKNIKSCSYIFTLPILLEIDNVKLLNMLESPQLLSAEVERVKQYREMCSNKEMVDQAVKEGMDGNNYLLWTHS